MPAKIALVLTTCLVLCLPLAFEFPASASSPPKPNDPTHDANGGSAAFRTSVLPLLAKYCTSCHGPNKPKGDLNLAALHDERSARSPAQDLGTGSGIHGRGRDAARRSPATEC